MPDWLITIIISAIAGVIAIVIWGHVFGSSPLKKEIDSNKKFSPPEDQQLRWHIEHMRQDIMSITRILFFIFLLLLIMLVVILKDFLRAM